MKQKSIKFGMVIIAAVLLLVGGCKKEEMPSTTVEASYPTITLLGDPVVILNVGDTYTDQGATYYDSLYNDNGTISTTTVVNTSEEGFYIVRYVAANHYGFEGSGTRLVAVTSISDSFDISGDYFHAARGGTATVSKVGKGVFKTSNVGGGGTDQDAYFMFKSDSSMVMPTQFLVNYGASAKFVDPVYDFTASPPNYSYMIDNDAVFGPDVRVFEKQ